MDTSQQLESVETLRSVGFVQETAEAIQSNWEEAIRKEASEHAGGRLTFENMITGHIRGTGKDAYENNDTQWRRCMDDIGITIDLQDRIMNPACKMARLSASCKFWLIDTMRQHFLNLQIPERGSEQIKSSDCEKLDIKTLATAAKERGNTMLFRAGWTSSFRKFFDDQGNPILNNIEELQERYTTGDFNSRRLSTYFVVDYDIAYRYAQYKKNNLPGSEVSILRVEIPNAAIEALESPDILRVTYPSLEWKNLVWQCRKAAVLKSPYTKYLNATLVIGSICAKPDQFIADLSSAEDIIEEHLEGGIDLGEIGLQYAFQDFKGLEFLEKNLGKCSILRIS